ncbi:hypothetical protein ACFQO4_06015 [Saliphagus sp. GCM10025334]
MAQQAAAMSLPVDALAGLAYGLLIGLAVAPAFAVVAACYRSAFDGMPPRAAIAVTAFLATLAVSWHLDLLETAGGSGFRLVLAATVAAVLGVYAATVADRFAATIPQWTTRSLVREPTLSSAALDDIDATGQVTVTATNVADLEGYPPLDRQRRRRLEAGSWRLAADLPLPALESRLEDRLRTAHDLAPVRVSIDARGRASIGAAPPRNGVSNRIRPGFRAVSLTARVPDGLAAGDRVRVETDSASVPGSVVDVPCLDDGLESTRATASDGVTSVTVAVRTSDAGDVLATDRARLVVVPDGRSQAFETWSLLERAGTGARRVVLDVDLLAELDAADDVRPFAARLEGDDGVTWQFEPDYSALVPGEVAIVVGDERRVNALSPSASSTVDDGNRQSRQCGRNDSTLSTGVLAEAVQ